MTITLNETVDRTYERALAARDEAARALYQAELALHDAHQTHIDQWIGAAHDRLHTAVTRYSAATAVLSQLHPNPLAA